MGVGGQGWISGLTGDQVIAAQFGDEAQFARFARFEQALISGLSAAGLLEPVEAHSLKARIAAFEPDHGAIAEAAMRDGVPVPEYVRQLRTGISGPGSAMIHHGATSQDLIDTVTAMALLAVGDELSRRLERVLALIDERAARDGENTLQAITRMQPALSFRARDRISNWQRPVKDLRDRLPELRRRTGLLQLGGAVGDLQALAPNGEIVAQTMARELGLTWPGHGWHTSRGPLIGYAAYLSELTGALGKIGQDVALMALRGDADIRLSGGGLSSAMPHKQNPVAAEQLVALARVNAALVSGMHQAQLHEMERSGAAWMVEWMVLPQMCEIAGVSLAAAAAMLQSIEQIGEPA